MNQRSSLFKELKRRNVFKVAIAYVVSSWLLAQVADLVLDNFSLPDWTMRVLLIALAIGFPIALIISWVWEVTSKGVIAESQIDRTISITDQSGKRLDSTIIAILGIIIIFMGLERFVFTNHDGSVLMKKDSEPFSSTSPGDVDGGKKWALTPFSVAVLPFAVTSTGPDDDYFADGLTEEIINALSQLPELMVTARTSAFYFKDQNIPLSEIAGQLGVANIVEGSVRRAGEQLRITAQLIRAADGFNLWSETYDRRTEDTFAVQQDIAEKIASTMNVVLDENQRERMHESGLRNVEAFIAYQKGIELFERAHTDGADINLLRQANSQFEEVVALVPYFSDAYKRHSDLYTHVLLSHASGQLDGNITDSDVETAPDELRFDYDQDLRFAQNDNQRLTAEFDRAVILGEWQGLSTLSDRALLDPGCEVALWAQLTGAPFAKGLMVRDAFTRMAACDPLDVQAQVHLAHSYLWLRNPQLALQIAEKALRLDDHHWLVWAEGFALAMQGNFEAAQQAVMNRPMAQNKRPYLLSIIAAMRGDLELASAHQQEYLARSGPDDQAALVMEAAKGNRSEANRLAATIDRRPFGYLALMHAIYLCTCGAPFDLEFTPAFDEMLTESGLAWPPVRPVNFPLKDW